jgi:hypothetical protein
VSEAAVQFNRISAEERESSLDTDVQKRDARISDKALLDNAGDREDLREEVRVALNAERARHGMTRDPSQAKKRDELLLEFEEAAAHPPRPKKSRSLASYVDAGQFFVILALSVIMMFLHPNPVHLDLPEWSQPVFTCLMGALLACIGVRLWVRQTLSFWLSLAIACVPQVAVSRWLIVNHPASSTGEGIGASFVSIFSGYVVGVPVFLLLQRLKPDQENEDI